MISMVQLNIFSWKYSFPHLLVIKNLSYLNNIKFDDAGAKEFETYWKTKADTFH